MSALGIYFGPKAITLVETKGGKIIKSAKIPQSTIAENKLEEKIPADSKMLTVIALLKDALRRNRIDSKEAVLCLSGKDLIIRTFEMPALPKNELPQAINFEVKKYIPFKVEDMVAGSQTLALKQGRANSVIFMGIKKETLDSYVSLLGQLELKICAIEYSGFSILRCLKLSAVTDSGIFAFLGADLQEEDEVNFTVAEDGFPLFSRDIILFNEAAEAEKVREAKAELTLEKLKTEIRISLDYYHRKFPDKNIKKLFLLINREYSLGLEAYISDTGLTVQSIDTAQCLSAEIPYSLSLTKALSASLSKSIKSKVKVDLLSAKQERAAKLKIEEVSWFRGLQLDYRMILLGLLICGATFGFGLYRISPLEKELKNTISMRPQVSSIDPAASYDNLTDLILALNKKLNALDSLIKKQLYATKPLDIIPQLKPQGVWLSQLVFKNEEGRQAELELEGVAYLGDRDQEFKAVNEFVAKLKANAIMAQYFTAINLISLDTAQLNNLDVTNFSLLLRGAQKQKKGQE